MAFFEGMQRFAQRIATYAWWAVAAELVVIWLVMHVIVRFTQSTRAAATLKWVFFVLVCATLVIRVIGTQTVFQRLGYLYENFLPVAVLALIVIFQPELRRALTRLGEASLFRRPIRPETATVDAVVEAAVYLSKAKFGGLVVLERQVPLRGLIEGGTPVNAGVTAALLQTIFFPGTRLHDLAVVIKDSKIIAAGVQLPLAEADELADASLGSRHRAAVGVSAESDALVVVVSEETGTVSLAERGRLTRGLSGDELRGLLTLKLNRGLVTKLAGGQRDELLPQPPPLDEPEPPSFTDGRPQPTPQATPQPAPQATPESLSSEPAQDPQPERRALSRAS